MSASGRERQFGLADDNARFSVGAIEGLDYPIFRKWHTAYISDTLRVFRSLNTTAGAAVKRLTPLPRRRRREIAGGRERPAAPT